MRHAMRGQRGIILIAVLFFIALLVSGVATFLRRATMDGVIARNRDLVARCEALARGGVQLATALLLQDRFDEHESAFRSDTRNDLWARIGESEIRVADGGRLRLRIEDAGARLNLNALLDDQGKARSEGESFLSAFFDKVIGEMQVSDEDKDYDAAELARNLIDYIDERPSEQDDYYQLQSPAYRAANRPLLSLEELGLVKGFDEALLDAIRPYATVYPYVPKVSQATPGLPVEIGINPNTAPSYVLATLYHGTGGDRRLADEETVRRILDLRDAGTILCAAIAEGDWAATNEECIPISEAISDPATIFPSLSYFSDVFHVSAEASYGDVRRTIEVVIDRSDVTNPLILSWRVR